MADRRQAGIVELFSAFRGEFNAIIQSVVDKLDIHNKNHVDAITEIKSIIGGHVADDEQTRKDTGQNFDRLEETLNRLDRTIGILNTTVAALPGYVDDKIDGIKGSTVDWKWFIGIVVMFASIMGGIVSALYVQFGSFKEDTASQLKEVHASVDAIQTTVNKINENINFAAPPNE